MRLMTPALRAMLVMLSVGVAEWAETCRGDDEWVGKAVVLRPGTRLRSEIAREGGVERDDGPDGVNRRYGKIHVVYRVQRKFGGWYSIKPEWTGIPVNAWVKASQAVLIERAIDTFSAEIKADPGDWRLYGIRGFVRAALHEIDQALDDFATAIRLNPRNAAVYFDRAWVLGSEPTDDKALADLNETIRLDPDYPIAHFNRSRMWTRRGAFDKAIADLNDAVRLSPTTASPFLSRAAVRCLTGDLDEGLADLDAVIEREPDNWHARTTNGIIRMAQGDYAKAFATFDDAVRRLPSEPWSRAGRLAALALKGSPAKPDGDNGRGIQLDRTKAYAHALRGWIWVTLQQLDKAMPEFGAAVRIDPAGTWPLACRANASVHNGTIENAIADLTEITRRDPANSAAYVELGRIRLTQFFFDKAAALYGEAIRINPDDAWPRACRAIAWGNLGRNDDAMDDCDDAIERDPKLTYAYAVRAGLWMMKFDQAKALADYGEAIRIEPTVASHRVARGKALISLGDFDRAIADLNEAIRLDPTNSDSYETLAFVQLRANQPDRAIESYSTAIRLDPKNAKAYAGRGLVWGMKFDPARAIADMKEAKRLKPDEFPPVPVLPNAEGTTTEDRFWWVIDLFPRLWILQSARPFLASENWRQVLRWAEDVSKQTVGFRKAISLARQSCEMTGWNDPLRLAELAEAYADGGDFPCAVEWQTKANALFAQPDDRARGADRLERYKARTPTRDRRQAR
jgi:tetratricopeptide (TPR) repeat protein